MDDETHVVVAPAEPDPWRPVSGADLCPLRAWLFSTASISCRRGTKRKDRLASAPD